jgi:uncharacterized protein YhaN
MELLDRLESRVDDLLLALSDARSENARLHAEIEAMKASLQQEKTIAVALREEIERLRALESQVSALPLLEKENQRLKEEIARSNEAKGVVALKIDRLLKKLSAQTI